MKRETNKILMIIFLVLLVVAFVPWGRIWDLLPINKKVREIKFSDFSKDNVSKVIIKDSAGERILEKKDGNWKTNDFSASEKEIEDFFNTLKTSKIESLASQNPDKHADFEASGEKGISLTLVKDGKESKFIIGKQGLEMASFYTKKDGGNNLYLMTGSLRDKLSQTILSWRDKTVVKIGADSIKKIETVSPSSKTVIKKDDKGQWQKEVGNQELISLTEEEAKEILAIFDPLEATDFLNDEEKKEFEKAKDKTSIKVTQNDEKTVSLDLLGKENEWWVKAEGKEELFKVASYKLKTILP